MCKKILIYLFAVLTILMFLIAASELYSYAALKNIFESPKEFLTILKISVLAITLISCIIIYYIWMHIYNIMNNNFKDVTGIQNKVSLEAKISEIAQRNNTMNVGLMMYDLNDFKHINDTYGHAAGDKLLQDFADCLSKILVKDSFLARFGGDEFLIVQENATPELMKNMSLKLCRIIDEYNKTAQFKISYAEGYDVSYHNHYFFIEDLLDEVDKKMYRDKAYKKKNITEDYNREKPYECIDNIITEQSFASEIFKCIQEADENKSLALIISDISNFHYFNNAFGYSVGNNILKSFCGEILNAPSILLSRHLHSDVFAALLDVTNFTEEELLYHIRLYNKYIVNRISKLNHVCHFKINSGIFIINDRFLAPEIMISNANTARRLAKTNSMHICCYNKQLEENEVKEAKILLTFPEALEADKFQIFLQPKVNASDGTISGAEALVRWIDGGKPVWNPDDFIPLLERTGYITELDYLVYEKCFRFLSQNETMKKNFITISLNVSPAHLLVPQEFIDKVLNLAQKYCINLNRIIFEITENAFIQQKEPLDKIINVFHRHGIRISMDDFGSGYSSLQLLDDIKFDEVKIDKKFFRNGINDNSKIILHEMIEMLKKLGKNIVCEGIEKEEVVDFLKKEGCDELQGFLFYQPMSESEFASMFSELYDEAAG